MPTLNSQPKVFSAAGSKGEPIGHHKNAHRQKKEEKCDPEELAVVHPFPIRPQWLARIEVRSPMVLYDALGVVHCGYGQELWSGALPPRKPPFPELFRGRRDELENAGRGRRRSGFSRAIHP